MILSKKQTAAIDFLEDNVTSEVLFGGAAGGGKSYLGCYWQLKNRLKYPGTRGLIGRSKLKTLKETTLNSFWQVCKEQGIKPGVHFKFNQTSGIITFFNGSEILLKDLFSYPSDPNFDELGSLEITDYFIDEANQISARAKQVVKSRVRYKLDEYGLINKGLMSCNPAKNWVYTDFFKPSQRGELRQDRAFIQSLVTDNPFVSKTYIENLKQLDDAGLKERLLYGNWDYDDDDAQLCDFDAISDLFTNTHVTGGSKYISSDLAMQGRDKFVSGYWDGLICSVDIDMKKSTAKEIEDSLRSLKNKKGVSNSRIVADSDGLGQYLSAYITGIYKFHGGKAAYNKKEYFNLKSECAYTLANKINNREIHIKCTKDQREAITAELSICLKRDKVDDDLMRKKIISKDKQKDLLGRSPDYMDMLLMRMVFENKRKAPRIAGG